MAEQFVKIADILKGNFDDKEVWVRGWIYRTRESGKLVFIILRDSTGIIQTVISKDSISNDEFAEAKKALIESSLKLKGLVVKEARAPGGYELQVKAIKIIGFADIFPIKEQQSEELLLDNRHLWVRSRELTAVMKVKATVLEAAREWFEQNGFWEVTPPIITPSIGEGGATVFELKYFGEKAYLGQTAQLYLEAIVPALELVYALTPSFRAEKSRTPRHLTEYWHLEGEEAWVDNEGNMKIQEELISYVCEQIAKKRKEELAFLGRNSKELLKVQPPFKRITYNEAVNFLHKEGFKFECGDDFGTAEERVLTLEEIVPIFVVNYPRTAKPAFYMKENPEDKNTVLCSDMLAPEGYGEIIGASERETDNDILIAQLKEQNAELKNYQWYLDLRKFGTVPHSGFGLGIERLVRWLCKLEHIRDATPFPRVINRFYP